mmetsp:Transcript_43872/g.121961  ORF Transcript_43872/g.121961 Transcript_43872/m.121961 type:complete len:302 (-) Transcript_43872:466-1371(-)
MLPAATYLLVPSPNAMHQAPCNSVGGAPISEAVVVDQAHWQLWKELVDALDDAAKILIDPAQDCLPEEHNRVSIIPSDRSGIPKRKLLVLAGQVELQECKEGRKECRDALKQNQVPQLQSRCERPRTRGQGQEVLRGKDLQRHTQQIQGSASALGQQLPGERTQDERVTPKSTEVRAVVTFADPLYKAAKPTEGRGLVEPQDDKNGRHVVETLAVTQPRIQGGMCQQYAPQCSLFCRIQPLRQGPGNVQVDETLNIPRRTLLQGIDVLDSVCDKPLGPKSQPMLQRHATLDQQMQLLRGQL